MDRAVATVRAVGEPTRLRIVALLAKGELTVSELVQVLGQSQPRVSRHLKLLAEAGLVERMPEGAWVFYRLADIGRAERRIADAAISAVPEDDVGLRRDMERLSAVKEQRACVASSYFRAIAQDWDQVRALHMPEAAVEDAMTKAAGPGPFGFLVDIGTGTGRILEAFSDRIRRGVGIDLSHEMLTVARANLDKPALSHCTVRHADLFALPFEDGAADIVTIHQVLHYLDDPARAITEAGRVLAMDGVLLVVDFAPHALEFLRNDHAHRRLGFSDDEVRVWLESSGLSLAPAVTLSPQASDGLTVKIWSAHPAPRAIPFRRRS